MGATDGSVMIMHSHHNDHQTPIVIVAVNGIMISFGIGLLIALLEARTNWVRAATSIRPRPVIGDQRVCDERVLSALLEGSLVANWERE